MKKFLYTVFLLGVMTGVARANDTDLQLSSLDGTTKVSFVNSSGVEVASITSNGDGYFRSINTNGNIQSYRVTGDTSTSAANLSATTLSFVMGASEHWSFEMNLFTSCAAGGGTVYALGTNVAPTFMRAVVEGVGGSVAARNSDVIIATGTATVSTFNTFNNAAAPTGWVRITGVINAGVGSTTVTLWFASPTSVASKVMLNSYVIARKLVN